MKKEGGTVTSPRNEMMPICKKIKKLRKQKGLTQSDLAKACGASTSAVSRWETGKNKHFRNETLSKLAKIFDVPITSLNAVESNEVESNEVEPNEVEPNEVEPIADSMIQDFENCHPPRTIFPDADMYVIAPDNSMIISGIKQGDKVLIASERKPVTGDIVVGKIEGSIVIRRYYSSIDSNSIILLPECPNSIYNSLFLPRSKFKLKGVAISVQKSLVH